MMVGGLGNAHVVPSVPMMGKVALSMEPAEKMEEFDPLRLKLDARFRP